MSTPEENERLARDHFLGLYEEGAVDRDVLADGFQVHLSVARESRRSRRA